MLVQELARMITGDHIYEHQAVEIFEKAVKNAALLKQLELIDPQWVQNYCAAQEWYVHTDYSHWQATAPKDRWKPYACIVLKNEKDKVTADRMWTAIHDIAKHYKTDVRNIIKEVMSYAPSVVDRLASLADDPG